MKKEERKKTGLKKEERKKEKKRGVSESRWERECMKEVSFRIFFFFLVTYSRVLKSKNAAKG